jgi:hypothetical protein
MTVYKMADLPDFVQKVERRMSAVVKQSSNDVIKMASRTAIGVTRGGELRRGYVPRDLGNLAASLVSELHGSTSITSGDGNYGLVTGSMKAGDVATFTWTAPYAMRLHYGYRGTDSKGRTINQEGWFWVDEAANHWPQIVDAVVARVKLKVGG